MVPLPAVKTGSDRIERAEPRMAPPTWVEQFKYASMQVAVVRPRNGLSLAKRDALARPQS